MIADDPDGFRLSTADLARFSGPYEIFHREREMSRHTQTIAPDYFEDLYAGDSDPWRFASSD